MISAEALGGACLSVLEDALQQWRVGGCDIAGAAQAFRVEWGRYEADMCEAAREEVGGGARFRRGVEEAMHRFITGLCPVTSDRPPDAPVRRQLQGRPPPGEEPSMELFDKIAAQTLCAPDGPPSPGGMQDLLMQVLGLAHAPSTGEGGVSYAYDGAHLPGGGSGAHAASRRCRGFIVAALRDGGSFADVVSVAVRGHADFDQTVRTALETATVHADWFVSGQAWHRWGSKPVNFPTCRFVGRRLIQLGVNFCIS